MKFIMTASANPKNHSSWFEGFFDGSIFEASSLDDAQDWLNAQCAEAGTNEDPHYDDLGPIATEAV